MTSDIRYKFINFSHMLEASAYLNYKFPLMTWRFHGFQSKYSLVDRIVFPRIVRIVLFFGEFLGLIGLGFGSVVSGSY